MFQISQWRIERVVGVAQVETLREIEGYDQRLPRCSDFRQALVVVAGRFDDVFNAEFLSDAGDAERVQFFGGFKYLRQTEQVIPGFEREVFSVLKPSSLYHCPSR